MEPHPLIGGGGWVHDASLQPVTCEEYQVYRKGVSLLIELSQPKNRNALTSSMVDGLRALYQKLARDSSVFRIYLLGRGKTFCAGMNLGVSGTATIPDENAHLANLASFRGLLGAIESAPQTTIALINGPCYGGGNGLAFANDIRLSTRDATFNLTEVRLGLSPCAISPPLAREWGVSLFRWAMLTARPVTAAQLQATGAIYDVAEDLEQLIGEALPALDARLQACAPQASAVCKELADVAWRNPGSSTQDDVITRRYLAMMAPSEESKYGIGEFRNGVRTVDWTQMKKATDNAKSRL